MEGEFNKAIILKNAGHILEWREESLYFFTDFLEIVKKVKGWNKISLDKLTSNRVVIRREDHQGR